MAIEKFDIEESGVSAAEKAARHFEGKLYNPRNAEGKPNTRELEQIRELDEALRTHGAYVGLAPYGSVVGGYGEKNSDIDVEVFFDDSLFKDGEDLEELGRIARAVSGKMREEGEKEFHIYFFDVLRPNLNETIPPAKLGHLAGDMFRAVTGEKIRAYRGKIVDYARRFPEDYQEQFRRAIVDDLLDYEMASMKKYAKRAAGAREENIPDFFAQRRNLIEDRVSRILKGSG